MAQGMGDNFGKALGSILGRRRSIQKRNRRKILAASLFMDFFKGAGQQLQQGVVDSVNTLNDKWGDITDSRNDLWKDWTDEGRKRLDEYNRLGKEVYLNQEAAKRINYSDAAIEGGITWENRNNPTVSKEAREALMTSFNAERERELAEINILQKDPRAQFETKTGFNEKAKNAYLAEHNLITKDPTRKGVIRNLFNRAFRTERDKEGNLVSTNAEKIELEDALNRAVAARNNQDADIKTATQSLDDLYAGVVGKKVNTKEDLIKLQNKAVILARQGFKQEEIITQKNKDKDIWFDKDPEQPGQYKEGISSNFKNANIKVKVTNKQKGLQEGTDPTTGDPYEYPIEQVDLLKNNLEDLKVQNSEGEIDPLTTEKFFDKLAITELALNQSLLASGKDALTGAPLIVAALELWSNEKRFSKLVGEAEDIPWRRDRVIWDQNDILVTLPTNDGYNLVNNTVQTLDAVGMNQGLGGANPDEFIPDDTDEDGIKKYNREEMSIYANDSENLFANRSKEEQDAEIGELIAVYPEHEKDIINIFSNSEYRKIQKEEKPQKRKQVVIDTSSQKEPTITTRGFEYTKAEVNEEDLEAIKKQIKTPFVKTRIERLAKAINTGKYGAVGSLLAKQTGEPYRTLTEEERKIAAQAIIDELLKDIG